MGVLPQALPKFEVQKFLSPISNFNLTFTSSLPTMAPLVPSQEELQRRRVSTFFYCKIAPANTPQIIGINAETVTNIPSTDFPGHWPGESHAWALDQFRRVCSSTDQYHCEDFVLTPV